jgi:hypothetical protein
MITQPPIQNPSDQFAVLLAHMHIAPPISHTLDALALAFERGIACTLRTLPKVVEAMCDVPLKVFRVLVLGAVEANVPVGAHDHVDTVELV